MVTKFVKNDDTRAEAIADLLKIRESGAIEPLIRGLEEAEYCGRKMKKNGSSWIYESEDGKERIKIGLEKYKDKISGDKHNIIAVKIRNTGVGNKNDSTHLEMLFDPETYKLFSIDVYYNGLVNAHCHVGVRKEEKKAKDFIWIIRREMEAPTIAYDGMDMGAGEINKWRYLGKDGRRIFIERSERSMQIDDYVDFRKDTKLFTPGGRLIKFNSSLNGIGTIASVVVEKDQDELREFLSQPKVDLRENALKTELRSAAR